MTGGGGNFLSGFAGGGGRGVPRMSHMVSFSVLSFRFALFSVHQVHNNRIVGCQSVLAPRFTVSWDGGGDSGNDSESPKPASNEQSLKPSYPPHDSNNEQQRATTFASTKTQAPMIAPRRAVPHRSQVIPEHRTAAWEVMSDDGQGLVMWQRQAPFAPSWTAGGRGVSGGGGGSGNEGVGQNGSGVAGGGGGGGAAGGSGGYNGFRLTAPVFVPEQVCGCIYLFSFLGDGGAYGSAGEKCDWFGACVVVLHSQQEEACCTAGHGERLSKLRSALVSVGE